MKLINTCIAALTLLTILTAGIARAETFMWKVSKGVDYFYLGGTIHVLAKKDHPLPKEFAEAYADADEIVFETDLSSANTPEFQSKLLTMMVYQDDSTLQTDLKPETFRRLRDYTESRGLPVSMFLRMQPWGVAITITMMEYANLGMVPEYGVEHYFEELAKEDGKEIQSLESVEEQMEFLSSFAGEDPDESINYTLDELTSLAKQINEMKASWREGNLEALENHTMVQELKNDFPEIYEIILKNRNDAWMKDITTFLDDDATEIVLVGAIHLPGEHGLIKQLRDRGFTIEQL